MKLVFATNNQHKLDEVQKITAGHTEIVSLAAIDCLDDIPETADTLEGNALQKARYVKDKFGYDCFADDTGLEVEALNNAPGVYSARYAGPGHDSEANMKKLLREMEGRKTVSPFPYRYSTYSGWKGISVRRHSKRSDNKG